MTENIKLITNLQIMVIVINVKYVPVIYLNEFYFLGVIINTEL